MEFSVGSLEYEIDLTPANKQRLREPAALPGKRMASAAWRVTGNKTRLDGVIHG